MSVTIKYYFLTIQLEIQIHATLKYHLIPIWLATKSLIIPHAGDNVQPQDVSQILVVRVYIGKTIQRTLWHQLLPLNILIPFNPTISFLGIYTREILCMFTRSYIQECLQFTIMKIWKEPKCPSMREQRNDLWYSQSHKGY